MFSSRCRVHHLLCSADTIRIIPLDTKRSIVSGFSGWEIEDADISFFFFNATQGISSRIKARVSLVELLRVKHEEILCLLPQEGW